VVFGELSTGASDDLVRATEIARSMVTRYAMVPELGHATYEPESESLLGQSLVPSERKYSEQTAREIDCATRQFVDGAFARARRIVEWNIPLVKQSAQLLLERETLEQAELAGLLEKVEAAEMEVPVTRFARPAVRGIRTRGHAPGAGFEL
jgi:cell division protease FtsH